MLGDITDEGGTTRSLSQITDPKVKVVPRFLTQGKHAM